MKTTHDKASLICADRSFLRIMEQEFHALPIDILLQGLVSFLFTMYGMVHIAGDFKEIRANVELEKRTWETLENRPSFYIFNHRGKALSPNYTPQYGKSSLEN